MIESSLIRTSSQMLVDVAPQDQQPDRKAYMRDYQKRHYARTHPGQEKLHGRAPTQADPRPADAIPAGTCGGCGLVGTHQNLRQCVSALRDRLADVE